MLKQDRDMAYKVVSELWGELLKLDGFFCNDNNVDLWLNYCDAFRYLDRLKEGLKVKK